MSTRRREFCSERRRGERREGSRSHTELMKPRVWFASSPFARFPPKEEVDMRISRWTWDFSEDEFAFRRTPRRRRFPLGRTRTMAELIVRQQRRSLLSLFDLSSLLFRNSLISLPL